MLSEFIFISPQIIRKRFLMILGGGEVTQAKLGDDP